MKTAVYKGIPKTPKLGTVYMPPDDFDPDTNTPNLYKVTYICPTNPKWYSATMCDATGKVLSKEFKE